MYLETDGGCHEISPSFAHTARLESAQAVGVGWATSETVGDTVAIGGLAKLDTELG